MKVMLAATVKDIEKLEYPLIVSPKLDGIRCVVLDGVAYSRAMKPIPNRMVQRTLGSRGFFNGLDGELIVGLPTAEDVFNKTTSGVMTQEGNPGFKFYVFDYCKSVEDKPFSYRQLKMKHAADQSGIIQLVEQVWISDQAALQDAEQRYLALGYEGLMLRRPSAVYKHGRSTLKEGALMKLKRFEDSEAEVIGMTELMHNGNEAEVNALGYKERSSKKANLTGKGTMGSLLVRDLKTGIEFEIGTGFTEPQRAMFWGQLGGTIPLGSVVKYKFQPTGVKDKPRFPVYLGFRAKEDLS